MSIHTLPPYQSSKPSRRPCNCHRTPPMKLESSVISSTPGAAIRTRVLSASPFEELFHKEHSSGMTQLHSTLPRFIYGLQIISYWTSWWRMGPVPHVKLTAAHAKWDQQFLWHFFVGRNKQETQVSFDAMQHMRKRKHIDMLDVEYKEIISKYYLIFSHCLFWCILNPFYD